MHIEHTFNNTAIIPKTGILLVTITVRLNFHNVTSLCATDCKIPGLNALARSAVGVAILDVAQLQHKLTHT